MPYLTLTEASSASAYWKEHVDKHATTIISPAKSRDEFIQQSKAGALDGVVAAYRTFPSVAQTGLWDAELCAALPSSLHFVSHNGAGYDQLSIPALTDHKILASNVPTAVDDATADTAVFLLLGALRGFGTSQFALRKGKWRGAPPPPLGHDPQGKVLGILGMGGIGRNMAKKCRALGMSVVYHNRHKLSTQEEDGAEYLGFDELLAKVDVLSVNVPLNPNTRHLLGAKELAKCKKGVCIVNTARGAVIDEAALSEALDSGHVGSVGLDVYEEEPKIHEGLVKNPRAFLLPHMGTWTKETQTKMEEWAISNVECWLKGTSGWKSISVVGEQKNIMGQWIEKGKPDSR